MVPVSLRPAPRSSRSYSNFIPFGCFGVWYGVFPNSGATEVRNWPFSVLQQVPVSCLLYEGEPDVRANITYGAC